MGEVEEVCSAEEAGRPGLRGGASRGRDWWRKQDWARGQGHWMGGATGGGGGGTGPVEEEGLVEEAGLGSGAGPAGGGTGRGRTGLWDWGRTGAGPVEEAGLPKRWAPPALQPPPVRWASRSSSTAPGAQSGRTAPEQFWADGHDTGGSVP